MLREKLIKGLSGWLMLVLLIALLFLFVAVFVDSVRNERPEFAALAMVLLILDCLGFGGFNELSDALRREQHAAAGALPPPQAPGAVRRSGSGRPTRGARG